MSIPSTPLKTAIVTGACSGIGLALTRHLLRQTPTPSAPFRWRVVLADINAQSYHAIAHLLGDNPPGSRTLFVQTDVSSWSDNARLFERAWNWPEGLPTSTSTQRESESSAGKGEGGRRIDFLAANAGTDDKERMLAEFDLDAPPEPPNLKCVDVNLISVFYQLKLFVHYARKTRRELGRGQQQQHELSQTPSLETSDDQTAPTSQSDHTIPTAPYNPSITLTSSCAGIYPFPPAPQYAATKHALVGLVRSTAASLIAQDSIRLNCVLPAFVPTNLAPPGLVDAWPAEHVTPVSTVVGAFEELLREEGEGGDGESSRIEAWDYVKGGMVTVLSDGERGKAKNGECVECTLDRLYYRRPVEYANDSQRWMIEETGEGGLWVGGKGYGQLGKK